MQGESVNRTMTHEFIKSLRCVGFKQKARSVFFRQELHRHGAMEQAAVGLGNFKVHLKETALAFYGEGGCTIGGLSFTAFNLSFCVDKTTWR